MNLTAAELRMVHQMAKHRDKYKGRKSRLVPYIYREPPHKRHARRHTNGGHLRPRWLSTNNGKEESIAMITKLS